MKGDEMSEEKSHYLEIVGSCRKVMTESKITEPADDDQTPRSSHCYASWYYEDQLPNGYPYDLEFPRSLVVDGVRMFPPHVCDWQWSMDRSTQFCKCGAWK